MEICKESERKSNYPFVFVHGFIGFGEDDGLYGRFPYWGITNERSAIKMARENGIECYAPSLGPFHSAWDRACELYARLVGGRVDYGKVHSEKYGHNRYGRTYKALIPDLGKADKDGNIKKVNLIGHSWGGPSTRMLIHLLAQGSEEERAGTPESELSGLFTGGKKNWIHSETTLAAVQNGSFFASSFSNMSLKLICGIVGGAGILIGETPISKIYDFRLDHFNVTSDYQKGFKIKINDLKKQGLKNYVNNTVDNVGYEMGAKYCREITKDFNTLDNIYYFSYAGCTTRKMKLLNYQVPLKSTSMLMFPFALFGGFYKNKKYGIDSQWYPNDGMMSVVGALAPFNEPQVEFDSATEIKPGIWHKMPVEQKDHFSYAGLKEDKDTYFEFFKTIFNRVNKLEAVE